MRVYYHGSHKNAHGLGTLVGAGDNNLYLGHYHIHTDKGHHLYYARRESFTILDDDVENAELESLHLVAIR